ncbi:MAG TPA: hypothetical protein VEX43_18875 [Chthoniobacterales bacterium]|nr:hypothetical protein [Chthoniobacterales bacterium]
MSHYTLTSALLLTVLAAFTAEGEAADMTQDVSMVQLIATPEKFDGKLVGVLGFLNLEFEGDALYLHREDLLQRLHKNAVWVDRTEAIERDTKKLNKHYVLIEGTFDARDHGHMGLFAGAIKDITRAETWPPAKVHFKDLTHRSPLLPDERKLIGSWEASVPTTGVRWIETYEADHTYWKVLFKEGEPSLDQTGRWYINENDRTLIKDPGTSREHFVVIDDIGENALTMGKKRFTRCRRPKKPSK